METSQLQDQVWREEAACRSVPVEIFYPQTDAEATPAKIVCRTCEVRETCLEWALAVDERFGVWGGLTPTERRSLGARRRKRQVEPVAALNGQGPRG